MIYCLHITNSGTRKALLSFCLNKNKERIHILPLMFGTEYRVSSQQNRMRELLHDLARARPLTRSLALSRFALVLALSCAVFRPCSISLSLSLSATHAQLLGENSFWDFDNFYRFFQYVASLSCRRLAAANGKIISAILRIGQNVRIFSFALWVVLVVVVVVVVCTLSTYFVYIRYNCDKKS